MTVSPTASAASLRPEAGIRLEALDVRRHAEEGFVAACVAKQQRGRCHCQLATKRGHGYPLLYCNVIPGITSVPPSSGPTSCSWYMKVIRLHCRQPAGGRLFRRRGQQCNGATSNLKEGEAQTMKRQALIATSIWPLRSIE